MDRKGGERVTLEMAKVRVGVSEGDWASSSFADLAPDVDFFLFYSREGTGDSPIVPPPPVEDDEGPVPPGIPPGFGS